MGEYICPKCNKPMCETKESCVVCRHCLFRCSIDWLGGWYAALNSGAQQPRAANSAMPKCLCDTCENSSICGWHIRWGVVAIECNEYVERSGTSA